MRLLRLILMLLTLNATPVWATWTYQSAGAVANDPDPRSLSGGIVIANPPALTAGDNVVIFVTYRKGQTGSWTLPSGWASVVTGGVSSETTMMCRTADSALVSAGGQQVNGSVIGNSMGVMLRLTGGNSDCTPHATNANDNSSATQDIATGALTISQANTLVITAGIFNTDVAASGVNGHPCGATGRVASDDTFGANHFSIYIGTVVQTAATNCSTGNIDLVSTNTAVSTSFVVSLPAAIVPPDFSVEPSVSSHTTTGYALSYTAGGASTFYAVAYASTLPAPTCTQIKAAQDATGSPALGAANEAVTGADTTTVTIPASPQRPVHNLAACLSNTTGDSSVPMPIANSPLDCPGCNFVTLASIASGSPCADFNTLFSPDIAASDVVRAPSGTSPGNCSLTVAADCHFEYSGCAAERELAFDTPVYDASAGAYHQTSDIDFVANNQGSRCAQSYTSGALRTGVAITTITLSSQCSDAEDDALTYTITAGSLPTGLSLASNGDISGTPAVEAEAGVTGTVTVSDPYGGSTTLDLLLYPITTVTTPDCTTDHLGSAGCAGLLASKFLTMSIFVAYHPAIAAGAVISQSPAAGTELDLTTAGSVAVIVSLGPWNNIFSPPILEPPPPRIFGFREPAANEDFFLRTGTQ